MKLYKYIGLHKKEQEGRIKSIIKNKEIFLTPYKYLNDPFEGTFRSDKSISYQGEDILINDNSPLPAEANNKIVCLTKDNGSILMWAHYANSFNGICLEFEVEENDCQFSPVKYVSHFDDNSTFNPLVKGIEWHYEKEFRYIHKDGTQDKEFRLFSDLNIELTGIYFGIKTSPCFINEIRKLCSDTIKLHISSLAHGRNGCEIDFRNFADISTNNFGLKLQPFEIE